MPLTLTNGDRKKEANSLHITDHVNVSFGYNTANGTTASHQKSRIGSKILGQKCSSG